MTLSSIDEADLDAYMTRWMQQHDRLLANRYFRGIIQTVSQNPVDASGGVSYLVGVVPYGSSTAMDVQCAVPSYTPAAGDDVECTWRDASTAYVVGPPGGATPILPAGFVLPYAGATAPLGYLLTDGSAVGRSAYSALFAAIGATWGAGDGITTFNLPTTAGLTLMGVGSGIALGSLDFSGSMPSHIHAQSAHGHGFNNAALRAGSLNITHNDSTIGGLNGGGGNTALSGFSIGWSWSSDSATNNSDGLVNTQPAGSGSATKPPHAGMNFCIKT